jgi:hypothetical protein
MKFDLMYYLGMSHDELMTLDLAELRWYHERLREVKAMEQEVEKVKLEATMAAMGAGSMKRQMGSLAGEG